MFLRKEQRQSTKTDNYFMSIISDILQPLTVTPITFLDQIYRIVKNQQILLQHILSFPRFFITKRSVPDATVYTNISYSAKKTSEIAHIMVPDIFDTLNGVADAIISCAEGLTDDINDLDAMSETAQAKIIRKISATSIKTDNIIYESFTANSTFDSFTNTMVHTSAGVLCLSPAATATCDVSLSDISVNKAKGELVKYTDVSTGLATHKFTDGYYFSRTFAANPVFEIDTDKQIFSMRDGDLTTEYRVEWCSENDNDELSFDFVITPTVPSKVDIINLVLSPCDVNSALSATTNNVRLSKMTITTSDLSSATDVLSSFVDNRINTGAITYGGIEDRPTLVAPYVYPSYAVPVFMKNVTSIAIQLVCDRPQKIYYLEKDVYDQKGSVTRTFNFLETLVLNKYTSKLGRLDPLSLFTKSQVTDYAATVAGGYRVTDRKVSTYRYSVGIRELALSGTSYYREGSSVTNNLNDGNKEIYSIELFANEMLFGGTSRYFVSVDKVTWIEVEPANRNANAALPTRVMFVDDNPGTRDFILPAATTVVYAKIYLRGDTSFSPVVKSFIARVKHI